MPLLYLPDNVAGGSHSVAINCQGDRVAVGAPASTDGENSGVAYILNSQTSDVLHTLRQPCPQRNDHFGVSIAMSCDGTRVLVGAKKAFENNGDTPGYQSPGVAYLFDVIDGFSVRLLQTFQNPDPQDYDEFGISLAMDQKGETVAIASPNHNQNEGIVYVFNKNGTLMRYLNSPILAEDTVNNPGVGNTLSEDQFFGTSLAMSADGNMLLVGAPGKGWVNQLPGLVFLFDSFSGDLKQTIHNPANRREMHSILPVEGSTANNGTTTEEKHIHDLDYFASTVAMSASGNTIVVGAMRADASKATGRQWLPRSETGLVYIFNIHGDLLKYYTSPNLQRDDTDEPIFVNDYFGISVSMDAKGEKVLVGSPHTTTATVDVDSNRTAIAFLFDQGMVTHSIYNPTTQSYTAEPILFGGSAVLAPSGDYAVISSAFHPVVKVVCLKDDWSCPIEDDDPLKPRDEAEYEFVTPPYSSVVYDNQQRCVARPVATTKTSTGGSSQSSMERTGILWIALGASIVLVVGCLFCLWRTRPCKKSALPREIDTSNDGDENIYPVVVSPSEAQHTSPTSIREVI